MNRTKAEPAVLHSSIADISPMLDGFNDQIVTSPQILSACNDPIKNDDDLQMRMALIDELYSQANSEDHAAAHVAELIADRVHEYEAKTF